jgi:hypothetical protein
MRDYQPIRRAVTSRCSIECPCPAKAAPIDSKPGRYQPPDTLLAFLETL